MERERDIQKHDGEGGSERRSVPLTVRKGPPRIHRHSSNPAEAVRVLLGIGGRQEVGWTCFVISMVLIAVRFGCCSRRGIDPPPYITNGDAI